MKLLARNSDMWKKDSLANNGFRRLLGEEFLSRCGDSLEGTKWNEIADHLGKPHYQHIVTEDKQITYGKGEVYRRYVLFTYSGKYQDYKVPGSWILSIVVLDGVIKFFGVQEVDG
ncbi:MAG: hypothetical protein EOO10_21195 [Chitinophagaceae bacterium]|nr:MAG: hypothetical protein EOO10_21195 [Chitinophagaceae bacterium]